MLSDAKLRLLEAVCAPHARPDAAAMEVSWDRQAELLFPEARRFHGWSVAEFDSKHEPAADAATAVRARTGQWPVVAPAIGRVVSARLSQALTLIMANQAMRRGNGTRMPSGLPAEVLASALLVFWTYEMELPLPEAPTAPHGHA